MSAHGFQRRIKNLAEWARGVGLDQCFDAGLAELLAILVLYFKKPIRQQYEEIARVEGDIGLDMAQVGDYTGRRVVALKFGDLAC